MRKGALKKKQRQLEELHVDRREALGELVLGMYLKGTWDDDLMSRGAAEVREVAAEIEALSAPDAAGSEAAGSEAAGEQGSGETALPATGEHTSEHDMPETAEHTSEHDMPETAEHTGAHELPETGPPTGETEPVVVMPVAAPDPETGEGEASPGEEAQPGKEGDSEAKDDGGAAGEEPAEAPERPLPSKAGAGTRPMEPAGSETEANELDRIAERIAATETEARTASEAAKAAVAADARTELSAITRELEADRSTLDAALKEAAGRIESAEKRADAAEAKLARESAANREAAAEWVRSQAAEIEADAALAAEIAADSGQGPPAGGDEEGRPELEARIKALETALEAEKASKAEALTVAESRLKAIEQSAREAERRVEEAEAAVTEAGTAPVSVGAAPGVVTEAEAREAAVTWLRGQIGALRQEIAKAPEDGGES